MQQTIFKMSPEDREKQRLRVAKWRRENRERHREIARRHYANNKEKCTARSRAYRNANPDKIKAIRTEYANNNKEEISASGKLYWQKHADLLRRKRRDCHNANKATSNARSRQYYKANRVRILEQVKKYRANPETRKSVILARRKYYAKCGDKLREQSKKIRQKNPAQARCYAQRKRAKMVAAPGSYSASAWMSKCEFYGWRCYYCDCALSGKNVTQDHAIPLSRGGSNFISNILPACRSCNSRKGAKTVFEFLALETALCTN